MYSTAPDLVDSASAAIDIGDVRRLPLGQRQVVVLALEGFSQREIGQSLGLEENAVTQRLSRARKQLREWLGGSI